MRDRARDETQQARAGALGGRELRYFCGVVAIVFSLVAASRAAAGDVPLYLPAPQWVVAAPLPDAKALKANAPAFLIFDQQQRIENGRLSSYVDVATRLDSPEMLARYATLTMPWAPEMGDLIVHELTIIRGAERIDLIAKGQKFTVLRREQTLEQLQLTGILTATLAVEGLQVGDILRFRATTTMKDNALQENVQTASPLLAAPAQVGFARYKISWPTVLAPKWKLLANGVSATPVRKGATTEFSIPLPLPKPPEMPTDAPPRYQHPPLVEISTFANWADVSKVMAPLYATEGALGPASPLAAEVAAIIKQEPTPIRRAQRALELVQDKIRYLAVGMDGGNYVPQSPAKTWDVRYGDCKAKTLLLLTMLRAMDIAAEPVLANVGLGDLVPDRLPSVGAFNHVFVRATIAGEALWLDGTGSGARIADIRDTPPFRNVLPVRVAGAALLPIETRANARPTIDLSITADESASVDLPSVFDATAIIRGAPAVALTFAKSQMGAKEQREVVGQFFQQYTGSAQFSSATITPDAASASVTLTGHGATSTAWFTDERKRKRNITRALDTVEFSPDRGRAAWAAIPVTTNGPGSVRYRLQVRLPDGGNGYVIEGLADLKTRLAGADIARSVRIDNGYAHVEERIDAIGGEIPAAQIPGEKDRIATAKAQLPRIVAPKTARRRWDLDPADPAGTTQVKAAEATFTQAIANDPEEVSGYDSRASFRAGVGDRRGAIADLTKALALDPTAGRYLRRSANHYELGDMVAALADAKAALQIDPSSPAINRLTDLMAENGQLSGALALLDERIGRGGDTRAGYQQSKATLVGEFGNPDDAMKLFETLIAEKPGSPSLLNARCWAKGVRAIMLDTALKDCTSAIELSTETIDSRDSRALIWYRLGRYEDALRDLDPVLEENPGLAESRFMRGIVLTRLKRDAEAKADFAIARRLSPTIDGTYARYGIKP